MQYCECGHIHSVALSSTKKLWQCPCVAWPLADTCGRTHASPQSLIINIALSEEL